MNPKLPVLSSVLMPQKIGYLTYRQFCYEYEEELNNIYYNLKGFNELVFDKLSLENFNKFIYKEYYIKQ